MSRRIHAVDADFFDQINTEERAYWLGFITADGCVYRSPRGVPSGITIRLGAKDVKHLEKWRAAIHGTHPIYTCTSNVNGKTTTQVRINVGSTQLARSLGNLGVTPAKSLTVRPAKIPPDLERHYWRGVFDGDGCLHRRSGRRRWSLGIVGTKAITDGFLKFLLSSGVSTVAKSRRNGKHIWGFAVCGVALPRQVARLLYDDASIYLDRKHSGYLKLAAAKDIHRRLGKAGLAAAKDAYDRLGTWKAAAKEVGISGATIRRMRQKWNAA